MDRKIKKVKIKPYYVKDETGKIVNIYLDIEAYNKIIKKVKEFEVIKKKLIKKK